MLTSLKFRKMYQGTSLDDDQQAKIEEVANEIEAMQRSMRELTRDKIDLEQRLAAANDRIRVLSK